MNKVIPSQSEVSGTFKGRKDIPEKLHPVCAKCIGRAREKYNGYTSDLGLYHEDGFAVNCPYIPHDERFWPEKLKKSLSPEDWNYANSLKTPLLWGEANLIDPELNKPWRAWPYQKGPLLCRSPRIALRFGRRCLPAGTPILMADGSWKSIETIKPGDEVVSNRKGRNVIRKVLNFWDNGEKDLYRVTLTNGMKLECTSNHPFLAKIFNSEVGRGVKNKWLSIEDGLKPGMNIAILQRYEKWGSESYIEIGKLLGYLLTDGYIVCGTQTPKFTNNSERMIEDVREISRGLFGYECTKRQKGNGWDLYITDGLKGTPNKLSNLLRELGLAGLKASNKSIPNWIYSWDRESVMALINRLFSGDGGIYCHQKKDRKDGEFAVELNLSSTSRQLLETVNLLLLKVGVQSYINADGKPDEEKGYVQRWKLKISSKDSLLSFFKNVGLIFGKEDQCQQAISALDNRHKRRKRVYDHCRFVSVRTIEKIEKGPTFDIEVEDTHNMVSGGIYTHNTGKSTILAVMIIWYLFTSCGGELKDPDTGEVRKNLKILLLAPFKSHVENIFDRIRAFLNLSPELSACIDRNKRGSPQLISLYGKDGKGGGNMISGFAAGDTSGSKGIAARGQDADLVITDEGAWISKEVMEGVIHPILYTKKTTRFIISSTPSGISGDYYETVCTNRPDFAEFYVPATDRPDWAEQEEKVKKDFGSNKEQWDKEVLALFSPAGIGVYRDELVRLGQEDFSYLAQRPNVGMIYTFGVDWNKEHGTEIAIVGTQKAPPHMSRVVYAINIPKKEFTTPAGISSVVKLNGLWRPIWIYVDDGGGDGAMMLQHHGRAMAGKNIVDALLMQIVKAYNFSSKIDIVDHSGKVISIPSKQFMVENSVKRFELQAIRYPREDLTLTKQLNNYIVTRRTLAGTPVYGLKEKKWGDHRLDAINLALVAVRIEIPSFFNEEIAPMGVPISLVRDANQTNPIDRTMIPMSVGGPRGLDMRALKAARTNGKGDNVTTWGTQPVEKEAGGTLFRRRGSRSRLFGR